GSTARSNAADGSTARSAAADPESAGSTGDPQATGFAANRSAAAESTASGSAARRAGGVAGLAMPPLTGSVNLTMPWATWLGISDAPGGAAGYGPLDASDARLLGNALAERADTKWCITLTDPEGRPVAHGCATPRPRRSRTAGSRGRHRKAAT